jgi:hypothetical protein
MVLRKHSELWRVYGQVLRGECTVDLQHFLVLREGLPGRGVSVHYHRVFYGCMHVCMYVWWLFLWFYWPIQARLRRSPYMAATSYPLFCWRCRRAAFQRLWAGSYRPRPARPSPSTAAPAGRYTARPVHTPRKVTRTPLRRTSARSCGRLTDH